MKVSLSLAYTDGQVSSIFLTPVSQSITHTCEVMSHHALSSEFHEVSGKEKRIPCEM